MATLPSPYLMRNIPQASRPVARIDPRPVGAVGDAIAGFGQTVTRIGQELQDHNDNLRLAGAKSDFLRARLAAEDEIPQGADYTQWSAQYETRLNEARGEIEKSLNGTRAREAFRVATDGDIIRGASRMKAQARSKQADQGRAYLDDLPEKNIAAAVTAPETVDRQKLLGAIGSAIDAAEGSNYISAVQAGALRRKVSEDYAKRRLSMLDPKARLDALSGAEGSQEAGLAAYLPPDEVEVLKRAAARDVEREMQRLQSEYVSSFDQYIGAVSSGADISDMLAAGFSDEAIDANISDAQVRDLLKQTRDDAVMHADYAQKLTLASPDEVNRMAAELLTEEVTTETGLALAASRERAHGAFVAAAQEDQKRRQADPAAYVMQDIGVRQAAGRLHDAPQDYARLSLLEQTRIGVPGWSQRLLTKPMAYDYAAQFNEMKPDAVAQSVKAFQAQWGEYGPRIIKEMEAAGLAPEYAVAMRHADNPGLAAEIAGLRGTTPADLKQGLLPDNVSLMSEKLEMGLTNFRAAFEAGDVTGQALETFNLNLGVAEKLALKYIRRGMDPTEAAATVAKRIFPETPINTSMAKMVIPVGLDPTTVTRHLETAMDGDELHRADLEPFNDPRFPEFANLEILIESLESRGIWLNNDTGDGAVLHIDVGGYLLPITRKGGDFYEVPYAEAKPGGYKPIRPGSRTKNIPTDWTVRD